MNSIENISYNDLYVNLEVNSRKKMNSQIFPGNQSLKEEIKAKTKLCLKN